MKRIFTCLLAAMCLCGAAVASVSVSPSPLDQGFVGELTLSFWPESDDPMYEAEECYSHMGLLTSASSDDSDIKYWAPGSEPYATTEPKWTKPFYSSSWELKIDNLYTYFGCPEGTDITGIAMWFHDGRGEGTAQESHDLKGHPWIIPIRKDENCSYTVLCKGEIEHSWGNGVLMIWDKGYRAFVTYHFDGSARQVDAHGGLPYLTWFSGSEDDEVGFDIIAAGGKVIYSEPYGEGVAGDFTLGSDVCGDATGDYTISNLQMADEGMNKYTFTWDENPNFGKYSVDLYNEKGWQAGGIVYEPTWSVNLSDMTVEGTYRVVVSGMDDDDYLFAPGAEQAFDFKIQNIGETTVRFFVPTDSKFNDKNGMTLCWWGPDDVQHSEKMEREQGSHWWTATINVTAPKFRTFFYSDLSETERDFADNSWHWYYSNEVCCEVNISNSSSIEESITYHNYDTRDVPCEIEDHDYRITELTTKSEDGTLFLEWKPSKDIADQYYVALYTDSYVFLASFTVENDTKGSWTLSGSEKEVEITMIEITPYVMNEYSPVQIVEAYISKDPVKVANPYMPTNIKHEEGGPVNTFKISWDASEKVVWYVVNVTDAASNSIFSRTMKVGEAILIIDGRCSIETDGLTVTGTVTVIIQAKDEEAFERASATYTFDVPTLENIGETTFAVLITPDCCYEAPDGIWFCWHSDNNSDTWIKASSGGSNIYHGSFTVDDVKYELTIGNKDQAHWSEARLLDVPSFLTAASYKQNFYVEQDYYTEDWSVKRLRSDVSIEQYDHNYIPQDVNVTVHEETGLIVVAVSVKDAAPKYTISLYDDGGNEEKSWTLTREAGVLNEGVLTYTLNPKAIKKTQIENVEVIALREDESIYSPCTSLLKNESFELPLNPLFPKGLKAVENDNHSMTLTWESNDGVDYYFVQVRFVPTNGWVETWTVRPDQIVPKDGKLSVTTSNMLYGNGKYEFTVDAHGLDGTWYGEAATSLNVSKEEGLGEVTVRVLIPSDNNFDVSKGVWLCYWFAGEERDADGQFVAMTENPASSRWYEAKFDAGTKGVYFFCVANGTDWSANPNHTYNNGEFTLKELCVEMEYLLDPTDHWELEVTDCAAENHDYTIKSVDTDNSKPGRVTFTIHADEIAPIYIVYLRENGSGDPYSVLCYFTTTEGPSTTLLFEDEKDTKYDYMLVPNSEFWADGKPYEGTVDVIANSNKPSDLLATVMADGQTVLFEWKKNGTEAASFELEIWDNVSTHQITDITDESYLTKYLIPGTYYWTLTTYDAEGNPLSRLEGPDFYVDAPDLRPIHPNVAVRGKVVTLAWQAPLIVDQCLYLVYDNHYDTLAIGHIAGEEGYYTTSFTVDEDRLISCVWYVISENAEMEYISHWEDGPNFMVQGSTETPTPGVQHKLMVLAAVGGYVNESVNGEWAENAKVVLRATPMSGWEFSHWSDDDTNPVRKITMDKDYTLTAIFNSTYPFSLTVLADEHGSVNSEVSGDYPGGQYVTIIATPDDGYVFDKWSDGNTEATREYLITADVILTAFFKAKTQGLEEVGSETNDLVRSQKILVNGELYILRDGKVYTVQGQRVR